MRSLISLTVAAVAAATLTAPASAASHHVLPTKAKQLAATKTLAHEVMNLRQGIRWHRTMTWRYQDRASVHRTATRYAERSTRSIPFLRWVNRLWWRRQVHAWKNLSSGRLPWTTDWQTAVSIVQRDWPGSRAWLLACSSSEGGWGLWVSNTQGSGAGGWMQYMEGTFYGDLRGALALARQERLPLPPRLADRWSSALGQAFAAGWAYSHSRPSGKWTGSRC